MTQLDDAMAAVSALHASDYTAQRVAITRALDQSTLYNDDTLDRDDREDLMQIEVALESVAAAVARMRARRGVVGA